MSDSAFQIQYRQEFIAAFEQHQTLLRETVTTEAVIKGQQAVFLVAGSGGASAVTRGLNGRIPARNDSNNQNTCTLQEWHDLVRKGAPPIFYTPRNGGHWVFLRYADIVECYRNHELFSPRGAQIPPLEPFPVLQPNGVDPPQHDVFRKILAPMFTPLAVRRMTDGLHHRASGLIAGFADKGECDFIHDYAAKFPTGTFLELFGLNSLKDLPQSDEPLRPKS